MRIQMLRIYSFMYCISTENRALAERESLFPRLLDSNSSDFSFQQTKEIVIPDKERERDGEH